MPKNSGKDKGSITQKADDQQVRVSQVSNVSKAVSAMGKKTTKEMKETERRIASGGDSKAIASSMNSVLGSLKNTIDSLEKGVEIATLGTARAAKEAIAQYGTAISEDFKINRQNMVASALATSTPIFGYFASKFMETGMFKKAKDKMGESVSNIFKKKSKGGSIPDSFDDGDASGLVSSSAKSVAKTKEMSTIRKNDTIESLKIGNRDHYETYGKKTENKTLLALAAIQGAVGAEFGKYKVWYDKFLLDHPFYRGLRTTFKAINVVMGGVWKAAYFLWRPRGGYGKQLSKAKNPFQAINQNLGAIFVQTMPRLDAIMIYTKATAMATRDLSSHVTGIKYPMMDPSKLGGTWSIAGVGMKAIRAIGRGLKKGAKWGIGKITKRGSTSNAILSEMINTLGLMGEGTDLLLSGPGRLKSMLSAKLPGAKESKRLFGGLGATGDSGEKIRLPKNFKGMGIRRKPAIYTQGVYDELMAKQIVKSDKNFKKLISYTANSSKYLQKHDKREKRRTATSIFSSIGSLLSTALGFLGSIFGGMGGGITGFLTGLATNPLVWAALGIVPAFLGTVKLWDWLDKKFGTGGSLANTIFEGFRGAFPQFDAQSAVTSGVTAGIGRLMKGEDFNLKQVLKDSISDLFMKKFGISGDTWWKAITGQQSPEEKRQMREDMMTKQYGEDRYAIEIKRKRLKESKGFTETSKAYLGLVAGKLKSRLGMDVGESKLDIGMLRAKKFAKKYGGKAKDYISMTAEEGKKYGEMLLKEGKEKAMLFKDKALEMAQKYVSVSGAKKLAEQYGGYPENYYHMTVEQARVYGSKIKDRAKDAYEKGTGKLSELSDKAGITDKREWVRRKAEELLASGEITKEELKSLGVNLKTGLKETGEAVGKAVVSSAAYTTSNISNAVNNMSSGGSGNSQKLINEKTMDEIAMGEVLF